MAHNRVDDITSNLSVRIFRACNVQHDARWTETKVKKVYTLWCITRGKVWIKINSREYLAESGSVVLFYPHDHYSAHTDNNGCEFTYIFFSLIMGGEYDLLSEMNLSGIVPAQKINQQTFHFCKYLNNSSTASYRLSLRTYSLFTGFLCETIDILRQQNSLHFHMGRNNYTDSKIAFILDYIAENYRENHSVRQLAQMVSLSEKHFINNFKKIVGISPGHYISQLRLRKAAEMLTDTDKTISEIAQYAGYSDQYSFSKAFKRDYGQTPAAFRKNAVTL